MLIERVRYKLTADKQAIVNNALKMMLIHVQAEAIIEELFHQARNYTRRNRKTFNCKYSGNK